MEEPIWRRRVDGVHPTHPIRLCMRPTYIFSPPIHAQMASNLSRLAYLLAARRHQRCVRLCDSDEPTRTSPAELTSRHRHRRLC
jgi:hypothetical protein